MSLFSKFYRFYCKCGHTCDGGMNEDSARNLENGIPTCQSQPPEYIIRSANKGPCPFCWRGEYLPLPPDVIEANVSAALRFKAERDTYCAGVLQRNAPLEQSLINLPIDSLSLVELRQLYFLYDQLLNTGGLGYSHENERVGVYERQTKLESALVEIPPSLIEQLSVDERLTHLQVLNTCFEQELQDWEPFVRTRPEHESEERRQNIDILASKIELQLALLDEAVREQGPPSFAWWCKSFATEWDHVTRIYRAQRSQWIRVRHPQVSSEDFYDDEDETGTRDRRLANVSKLLAAVPIEDTSSDRECSICRVKYGISPEDGAILEDANRLEEYHDHAVCVVRNEDKHMPAALPCNHIFGSECVTAWLATETTCPICRRDFEEALLSN